MEFSCSGAVVSKKCESKNFIVHKRHLSITCLEFDSFLSTFSVSVGVALNFVLLSHNKDTATRHRGGVI